MGVHVRSDRRYRFAVDNETLWSAIEATEDRLLGSLDQRVHVRVHDAIGEESSTSATLGT